MDFWSTALVGKPVYRWMNWLYKAQLDNQRTKLRLLKIKNKTKLCISKKIK